MKTYTLVTPSHRKMAEEYLFPTIKNVDLTVIEGPQLSNGKFGTGGWAKSLRYKMQQLQNIAKDNYGDVFAFVDADVTFFGDGLLDVVKYLGDYDGAFQHEQHRGLLCSGLFVAHATETFIRFLDTAGSDDEALAQPTGDQAAMQKHSKLIRWAPVPSTVAWCIGHARPKSKRMRMPHFSHGWYRLLEPRVPRGISAFHANWVRGIDNKRRLLDAVRAIASKRAIGVTS